MVEFMVISWLVARFFVRNAWQDAMWLHRGEDPPSYRREMERHRRRGKSGSSGPGPARSYLKNAWADAIVTAEEHRTRRRDRRATARREKWAAADAEQAESRREDASGRSPDVEPCGFCGKPFSRADLTTVRNAEGEERRACANCLPQPDPPEPTEPERVEEPPDTAPGPPPLRLVRTAPEATSEPPQATVPAGPTSTSRKEPSMSELVSLPEAINWAGRVAEETRDAANSIEFALNSLASHGVTGIAPQALAQAREHLAMAADAYQRAQEELLRHTSVAEAYSANTGAGEKDFLLGG